MYKIVVAGIGYVGLANAVLLAQHNEVVITDVQQERVDLVNARNSPIVDQELEYFLRDKELNLRAAIHADMNYKDADFVVVATPTNYDPHTNCFDTSSVESVIHDAIACNPDVTVVVKSTIPVGFIKRMRSIFGTRNIMFSPEFLREGHALHDNLYPSRIILGCQSDRAKIFAGLLLRGAIKTDIEVLFTDPQEAESIKLFSNTYLAMRVAFFNELDSFAMVNGLSTRQIIDGVCSDSRIGNHYNNPSFGYGGYCLPKDTKQLVANYSRVPQNVIGAVVNANRTRKEFLAHQIVLSEPKVVGVYRLAMKARSDNYREAAVLDIMEIVKSQGIDVILYEPTLKDGMFQSFQVLNDLVAFKRRAEVIIVNRLTDNLNDVKNKVFTRDLFGTN
jgi:UDPglucose 6-dehydrogenase